MIKFKFLKSGIPDESAEQIAFFNWARGNISEKLFGLLFSIPNGARTSMSTAKRLKAEGLKSGVPDIFFACPLKGYAGLFIEMKNQKGGQISPEQKAMIERLRQEEFRVEVCNGNLAAQKVLLDYLSKPPQKPEIKPQADAHNGINFEGA